MKKHFLIACVCTALAFASCGGGAGNQQNQTGGPTGESAYETTDSARVDTQVADTSSHDTGAQGQPGN